MTSNGPERARRYGIRVAVVAPGDIDTEMCASIRRDVRDRITRNIPVNRFGETQKISDGVRFIIHSDFLTGRIPECDEGMMV